ncbi:hypothetical protein [Tumebacillus permanentifrigoris]|uniref:Uncharacterized protein n=1 Tax=Tumebacillus permanentifrigoris TaxID=378543 RepID=A0A316DEV5_9BACL|nr:hypothetical protein [Tumebacillus permanentifrigoris]PWK16495.1 hypothetical protein C7459_101359 [Tumebacillus permanentifrigoris]
MLSFFNKNKLTKGLSKLQTVQHIMPTPDVLDFFGKLSDAYRESLITTREMAAIEAQKEILLTEIENKYDLYHTIFQRVFDERQSAVNKSFEIIDKGLLEGDRELIGLGMQSLSKIVSSSPFANMQELSRCLESDRIIEI